MDWSKLVDWLKLGPTPIAALVVASGVLVFSPVDFTAKLGVSSFLEQYRFVPGLVFLVSGSFLLAQTVAAVLPWLKKHYAWYVRERRGRERLHKLTPAERDFLSLYIQEDTRSQYSEPSNGVTCELESAGIIRRASNLSAHMHNFAYNIQPWAFEYLKKQPWCLEGAPSKKEKERRSTYRTT